MLLGCGPLLTAAVMSAALAQTPVPTAWRVEDEPDEAVTVSGEAPAVVVCTAAGTADARHRYPTAHLVALVRTSDAGDTVHIALRHGAATCVPGVEPRLVAAFVFAVARRQGFIEQRLVPAH